MPKINEIFAFISADSGPNDEGLIATRIGNNWFPLVGADKERVDSLRKMAAEIAKATGKPVVLARFSKREDLETIKP